MISFIDDSWGFHGKSRSLSSSYAAKSKTWKHHHFLQIFTHSHIDVRIHSQMSRIPKSPDVRSMFTHKHHETCRLKTLENIRSRVSWSFIVAQVRRQNSRVVTKKKSENNNSGVFRKKNCYRVNFIHVAFLNPLTCRKEWNSIKRDCDKRLRWQWKEKLKKITTEIETNLTESW